MKARRGDIRAFATIIGVLVAIGGVAVTVYVVHGSIRRDRLTERNYRALAMASEQLRDRIEGLRVAIATDQRCPDGDASESAKQPPFTCAPMSASSTTSGSISQTQCVASAIATSPASKDGTRMAIEFDDRHGSLEAYVSYDSNCDQSLGKQRCSTVGSEPPCSTAGSRGGKPNNEKAPKDICQLAGERGSEPCTQCAVCSASHTQRIALQEILTGLLPDEALFDAVVLTLGTESIALRGPVQRDAKLGTLLTTDTPATETRKTNDGDVKEVAPVVPPNGAPKIAIQGETYYRFTKPIDVSTFVSSIPDAPGNLQLHGLVRTATFERDTQRIGDSWVLTLLLVLVLAALSWPLLKLWYMGPAERLRGFDVRILALAMMIMAGVVTLLIPQLAWQQMLANWFDGQLGALARSVGHAITKDLDAAVDTLARAETAAPGDLRYHDFDLILGIGERAKPIQRCSPSRRDGHWELQELPLPRVDVSDRQYYQDVIAENFAYHARRGTRSSGAPRRFALEVVRSKTTGALTVVLARRAAPACAASHGITAVLIAMNASDILHASLPPGFQFAVVDANGSVQLHSDAQRSGVENLLDQCNHDRNLTAALRAGQTSYPIAVDYAGTGHHAVVRKIPRTPWRVVALQSDTLLEKMNDEIVAHWSAMFLIYAAAVLSVMLVVQIVDDGYRAEWVWPDRRFPWLYGPTAVRLLITAAVSSIALEHQAGLARLALPLTVTAGTIGALALSLHKPRAAAATPVLQRGERYAAWFVALAALIVSIGLAVRMRDCAAALAFVGLALLWQPVSGERGGAFVSRLQKTVGAALALAVLAAWCGRTAAIAVAAIAAWPLVFWMSLPASSSTRSHTPTPANQSAQANRELRFRLQYAGMAFALLLVAAVVPAYAFARDARAFVWAALARFGQTQLRDATKTQELRARNEHAASRDGDPAYLADRLTGVRKGIFATAWIDWDESGIPGMPAAAPGAPGTASTDALLSSYVMPWLPVFESPVPELRSSISNHPDPPATGGPYLGPAISWRASLVTGVGAGLAALVGYFLVWSVARLIFLLDVDRHHDGSSVTRGTLTAWQYTGRNRSALPIETAGSKQALIDLRVPMTVDELTAKALAIEADSGIDFVEVDHPAYLFEDLALHAALLRFLETLMRGRAKTIVLTSDIDPLHWTFARELEWATNDESTPPTEKTADAETPSPRAEQAAALVGRWASLLSEFSRNSWQVPSPKDKDEAYKETSRILAAKYPTLSEGIAGSADDPRHWTLWRQCTRAEKLALRQLADEGFFNPNSIRVVRRLSERLLVFRDPAWSLMTPSFQHFVRRAATTEMIRSWEQAGERSSWAQLRGPLAAVALIAAIYLVLAQRETLNSTLAVVTAAMALVPALIKLFGAFGDSKSGQ